jgi:O-glycosyl hydrolase
MKKQPAIWMAVWAASTALLGACGAKQATGASGGTISSGGRIGTGGELAAGGHAGGGGPSSGGTSGSAGIGGIPQRGGSTGMGGGVSPSGGQAIGGRGTGGQGTGQGNGGVATTTDGAAGAPAVDAATAGGAPGNGGVAADARTGTDAALRPDTVASGGAAAGGSSGKGGTAGTGATGGIAGTGGKTTVVAAPGTTLVKVDVNSKHQTFEGWGTSLAWWAYQIGGWSASKRNQFLDVIVDPVAGLGYNIFRYNIGGGDAPGHSHMDKNRQMPGFKSQSGAWDWNADSRQTSVLTRLVSTGKNVIIEAFSNSPPYWMTKSGCASGSSDGSNNLKDDAYETFADYLTEVTKHYRDTLGIAFRTLEPMNEPNANWWKANGGQEGCHFSAANQQQIIKAVSASLAAKGLTDTRISASDENSMDDAYSIMSGYDTATLAAMAQMNVHSYAGSKRSQVRTLATSKNKRLWQSESGPLSVDLADNTAAAIFMAGRIIQDLRELEPEAWIEWQVVDPGATWTSFTVNDSEESWKPVKRFHMQSGFSRYIRPGATFVAINNADMVAALSADGSTLTIVARNGDTAASKGFTFDLTSLPSLGSSIDVYRTSSSEDLAHLPAVSPQGWTFSATIPPSSVTTFIVATGR